MVEDPQATPAPEETQATLFPLDSEGPTLGNGGKKS
jgi:hypothetical protein